MKMKKEIKIGIIMALVLGSLIWGISFLKGRNFFSDKKTYFVIYDDISGLAESNGVFVKGYKVGLVRDINFLDKSLKKIKVTLAIDKNIQIPIGSIARIYSLDLIGNKAIELKFSKNAINCVEGEVLYGDLEITLSQQLEPYKIRTYNLLKSADSLANSIISVFNPSTINNLNKTLYNLKTTTDEIAQSASYINYSFQNIEAITHNLMDNNKRINTILKNMEQISDSLSQLKVQQTFDKLNITLSETNDLIAKVKSGQGTIGKLINNDSLYRNLNSAAANIDTLVKDLKNNPKKYLQFSVFGSSKK